jgi:hypothetical protein
MLSIAGGATTKDSAYLELIVSFGLHYSKVACEILLASFMGTGFEHAKAFWTLSLYFATSSGLIYVSVGAGISALPGVHCPLWSLS